MSSMLCLSVQAKTVYYTNDEGVEMTELEYNKMLQLYSERRLRNVTQEEFDLYKDATVVDSGAVYHKTTYKYGEVVSEEMVSEEEYNSAPEAEVNVDGTIPLDGDYGYVETTYKRLSASLVDHGSGQFALIGSLSWKKMPACRSYDVFAYRFMHFNYNNFAGSQAYYPNGVYNSISYNTSSPGYKALANGAGVSMNLVDGSEITGYELAVATNLTVNTTSYSQAHAYISYQHAQSDLTRVESMNYNLDISGLGNVILFNSSATANKYDRMAGVHLTTPI